MWPLGDSAPVPKHYSIIPAIGVGPVLLTVSYKHMANAMQIYCKVKLQILWSWRTDNCQQSYGEKEPRRGSTINRSVLTVNKRTGKNQQEGSVSSKESSSNSKAL